MTKKAISLLLSLTLLFSATSCSLLKPIATVAPADNEALPLEPELSEIAPPSPAIEPDTPIDSVEPFENDKVTITMVGDILLHTKVANSGRLPNGDYNYDHLFENVKDIIEAADIAIVNQEVILGGRELGLSDYPMFNGAYEVGDSLVSSGFDIILHATNHTLDKGKQGVFNCMEFWEENYPDTAVLGINMTEEEESEIYIREENGIKIAFLNYTYGTNGIPIPKDMPYIVNILSEERLRRDIRKAEEMADFTVVLPHWGTEYVFYADRNQKNWTDIMFSEGADLVIGTHPHVVQPIEMIESEDHSMLVYYSIGNFVNSTAQVGAGIANRMLGGIADITLEKDENGEVFISDYGVIPIVSHVRSEAQELTVYKLSDYTKELALQNEIIYSDGNFSLEYCKDLAERVFGDIADYD